MNLTGGITTTFDLSGTIPVHTLSASNWILATGLWNDSGVYEDTAVWID